MKRRFPTLAVGILLPFFLLLQVASASCPLACAGGTPSASDRARSVDGHNARGAEVRSGAHAHCAMCLGRNPTKGPTFESVGLMPIDGSTCTTHLGAACLEIARECFRAESNALQSDLRQVRQNVSNLFISRTHWPPLDVHGRSETRLPENHSGWAAPLNIRSVSLRV